MDQRNSVWFGKVEILYSEVPCIALSSDCLPPANPYGHIKYIKSPLGDWVDLNVVKYYQQLCIVFYHTIGAFLCHIWNITENEMLCALFNNC